MQLPAYVVRDHDVDLRTGLREVARTGGVVLVLGDSSAGKSRSLYEAIRTFRRWRVFIPGNLDELLAAKEHIPKKTVVWIDDTGPSGRLLRIGAKAVPNLNSLCDQQVLVAIMRWPEYHSNLAGMGSVGFVPGVTVHLDSRFSEDERRRAIDTGDERFSTERDARFGETQILAGTPVINERWENASLTQDAVITAAVVLARVGYAQIDRAALVAAARAYLNLPGSPRKPDDALPDGWFDDAISYATRKIHDLFAVLVRKDKRVAFGDFEVVDQLQHSGKSGREAFRGLMSDKLWEVACEHAPRQVLLDIAGHARARLLYRHSERFYRRAVDEGESTDSARMALADLLGELGRSTEALAILRLPLRSKDAGNQLRRAELLSYWAKDEVIDVLPGASALAERGLLHRLARLQERLGVPDQAVATLQRLVSRDDTIPGDSIALAQLLRRQGQTEAAMAALPDPTALAEEFRKQAVDLLLDLGQITAVEHLAANGYSWGYSSAQQALHQWQAQQATSPAELENLAAEGNEYAAKRLAHAILDQDPPTDAQLWARYDNPTRAALAAGLTEASRHDELRVMAYAVHQRARLGRIEQLVHVGDFNQLTEEICAAGVDLRRTIAWHLAENGPIDQLHTMAVLGDMPTRSWLARLAPADEPGRFDDLVALAHEVDPELIRRHLATELEKAHQHPQLQTQLQHDDKYRYAIVLRVAKQMMHTAGPEDLCKWATYCEAIIRRDLVAEAGNHRDIDTIRYLAQKHHLGVRRRLAERVVNQVRSGCADKVQELYEYIAEIEGEWYRQFGVAPEYGIRERSTASGYRIGGPQACASQPLVMPWGAPQPVSDYQPKRKRPKKEMTPEERIIHLVEPGPARKLFIYVLEDRGRWGKAIANHLQAKRLGVWRAHRLARHHAAAGDREALRILQVWLPDGHKPIQAEESRADDAGLAMAMEDNHDIDGLRQLAIEGNLTAQIALEKLLPEHQLIDEMIKWAKNLDYYLTDDLVQRLVNNEMLVELRKLADAEGPHSAAHEHLVALLAKQGNVDELCRMAVNGEGHHAAFALLRRISQADDDIRSTLENLLYPVLTSRPTKQGDEDDRLRRIRRYGLNPDGSIAEPWF